MIFVSYKMANLDYYFDDCVFGLYNEQLNRLLESADRNHFGNNNNHKLSGFDEGKGEFYHEVEEYDGEFYESQNSES